MRVPSYNSSCRVCFGLGTPQNGAVIFPALICEMYETSVTKRGGEVAPAGLAYWTLLTANMGQPETGYNGLQDIWYPNLAWRVDHVDGLPGDQVFYVRAWGARWLKQPAQHCRWYLVPAPYRLDTVKPQPTPPVLGGVPVTFDCFRPFGSATPVFTNKPGTLYADLAFGRGGYSGGQYSMWTHYLDFDSSLDVRDASSRAAGLDTIAYSDGDGVSIPTGAPSTKYVVMRVITYSDPGGIIIKRAYLVRDQPKWPGP